MQGIQNPIDQLWDIPVSKKVITAYNYPIPSIHPGLYPATTQHPLNKTVNKEKVKISSNAIFKQQLSMFGDIIDKRIIDNFLQTDKRQPEKEFVKENLAPKVPSMAVIIKKKQTHTDLTSYLHAACFSPVRSTFCQAITQQFFKTWPGLTPTLINRHLPPVIATAQGHMHQERQNLQSTKGSEDYDTRMDKIRNRLKKLQALKSKGQTLEEVFTEEIHKDNFPKAPTPNIKTNDVAYILIDKKDLSTAYTDLTGKFPMRSSRGNQYILIGYHYDANCIHGTAIKDRTATTLTKAWQSLHNIFAQAGVAPNTYVMDNEISADLMNALK